MTVPLTLIAGDPVDAPSPKQYPRTDIGNAERLVHAHGHAIRFEVRRRRWHVWDGTRWAPDDRQVVQQFAKRTVRAIRAEVRALESKADQKDLAEWAAHSEGNVRIKALLERAESEPGIPVTHEELDRDPFALNLLNGTLDLRTGELHPHDRTQMLSKLIPIPYDAAASCPQWLAVLDRIFAGDTALIDYLQRAVGYSLTGDTREQCLHVLYGGGANGKSVFAETLMALLGEYALEADFATFLEQQGTGPRNDIARLAGARLVRSSELAEGKRLNESVIKALTGNATVSARFLYAEPFTFTPTFKLWFDTNHKPVVRGTDYAIWRRLRLIPFTVTIPEGERDETLRWPDSRLRDELPGILNWAIAGCLRWLESGLQPPENVVAATDQYRADSDTIGAFIEEACAPGGEVRASELYQAFRKWADENGEYVLTNTAFGRRLEDRGLVTRKSHGTKIRIGIHLTTESTGRFL
jgi:putative DNA primase/helicase